MDVIRKSQRQQKLTKKITHFTIQFRSKNFTQFTNLNSQYTPTTQKKPFSLYKFFSKHVSVCSQKNYLHNTISWRPRSAFLEHWWDGGGGRLNNFPMGACCLDLVTIFQHLNFPSIALKPWNFPDNLDFKDKIVSKFLQEVTFSQFKIIWQ